MDSAAILVAGWILASVGETLAGQTGLGMSFVGFALVALSITLPELSTCTAAAHCGAFAMAVANILGTNCLEVALFILADVFYRPGPNLARADRFAVYAGVLGVVVRCIYLCCPVECNRKVPRAYDEELYRERNPIERLFATLKQCRRIAKRYDKTARNFLA